MENWPEVIDSLFLRKELDLYLTGSNAYLLSSKIATMISERYVELKMLPLSFGEYVFAMEGSQPLPKLCRSYIETTFFPYGLELQGQPKELQDYLEGIYNTVVVKDLVSRKKIPDVMMLESVARSLFDAIDSPLSTKKIADTMTSSVRKIDVKIVEKYADVLMESFIVYQVKRYNIKM